MSAIRSKHTQPEKIVRTSAHKLGLRFRLHTGNLPGRPDLVLRRWRTVIFVNGCFWHQHPGCKKAALPKTNVQFWRTKLKGNVTRDFHNYSALEKLGWRVLVLWQCEVRSPEAASSLLRRYFKSKIS